MANFPERDRKIVITPIPTNMRNETKFETEITFFFPRNQTSLKGLRKSGRVKKFCLYINILAIKRWVLAVVETWEK